MERIPAVYILASQKRGTLYIGVTSDPLGRLWQHREGAIPGLAARYGVKRLVYIEFHATMEQAILREKQLKRWPPCLEDQPYRGREPGLARSGYGLWIWSGAVDEAGSRGC